MRTFGLTQDGFDARGKETSALLNSGVDRRYGVDDDSPARRRLFAAAFVDWLEHEPGRFEAYARVGCDLLNLVNDFFQRFNTLTRQRFPPMP